MYRHLLERFVEKSREILGAELTGVYLHGSMAMGCFLPDKSDIDLIVVIEHDLADEQKLRFMKEVVACNQEAPKKGIEMSVVKKTYCKNFVYPTPFALHFSNAHLQWFLDDPLEYVQKMKGTDPDLAAHFTIIRHYGRVLYGEEIASVFSEVPKADYIDSIWNDIAGAKEEILENPVYMILNLCRVAACVRDDLVTSKKQGGEWGLQNLERQYRELIETALACYASEKEMAADPAKAQAFAAYMLRLIRDAMG